MSTLGAAIVGTGFMGWVHAEALRRLGVSIVGICGSSEAKARAAAQRLAIDRAYGSFEELLADNDVQTVHIGTPNRLHFQQAKQALAAGKHVLCEKPLAMTSAESSELVRIAAERPEQAAGVNYNIRFYPLCAEARSRIRTGRIGAVRHVTGSYVQDWLTFPTDYNWRVLVEENGELRAVADIGTHWLDLVQHITGLTVEAVCADLMIAHPERQRPRGEVETFQDKGPASTADRESVEIVTEDYGAVLLRFQGGVRGCLQVSQITPGRKNCLRFEIAGDQQALAWNSESPNDLWIGHRDEPNELLHRDPALLQEESAAMAVYPGGHNEGYADSFKQCFRSFYEHIENGDWSAVPRFPTFADGHREVLLCEAILESHRRQRWIAMEGDR